MPKVKCSIPSKSCQHCIHTGQFPSHMRLAAASGSNVHSMKQSWMNPSSEHSSAFFLDPGSWIHASVLPHHSHEGSFGYHMIEPTRRSKHPDISAINGSRMSLHVAMQASRLPCPARAPAAPHSWASTSRPSWRCSAARGRRNRCPWRS